MATLYIDNRKVEVGNGATILDAARKLGIEIPTLCFREGCAASPSCMVCAVRVNKAGPLVPACATKAADGMRVESDTDEVRHSRRMALELLLGDHLGDCVGPCEAACPAHMNIPQMVSQIAAGHLRDAVATIKRHIALPAVLGLICPAPCEKACRRGAKDDPVSICLLKRYAADADLKSPEPYQPDCKPPTGRRIAVAGAGPAGLAAAYYLLRQGHACTVFDNHDEPGGMLRYAIEEDRLPRSVLDAEIALIEGLGAEFQLKTRVGADVSMAYVRNEFDAVLIATGAMQPDDARAMGIELSGRKIKADKKTSATSLPGVFSSGGAVSATKMAVRSAAAGRGAAIAIGQYLSGAEPTGERRPFSVHIGLPSDGEMEKFMESADPAGRTQPSIGPGGGFDEDEARKESTRCLHCDCRKRDACKLRDLAEAYGARPNKYRGKRRTFEMEIRHPDVVYEPGKCIDCGICVRIAEDAREPLGLAFVGRGFDVRVAAPFGASLADGIRKVARECVDACPTGALAFKNDVAAREHKKLRGHEE